MGLLSLSSSSGSFELLNEVNLAWLGYGCDLLVAKVRGNLHGFDDLCSKFCFWPTEGLLSLLLLLLLLLWLWLLFLLLLVLLLLLLVLTRGSLDLWMRPLVNRVAV